MSGVYVYFSFIGALVISWVINLIKLIVVLNSPDFQYHIGLAILHGIGLIPFVSLVTVWF